MKRIVALVCLVGAGAFAASVALAGHGNGNGHGHGHGQGHGNRHGHVIHVVEHATTDAISNTGGGAGDAVGNILTFNNDVFDQNDSAQVGTDQGYCVRLVVGVSWECNWTTLLAHGQITVEGPFYDTQDSVVAVTGGTGRYANVRGSMELKSRAGGTEYDFIFHLIG
jgi:allene oxide cyclase